MNSLLITGRRDTIH